MRVHACGYRPRVSGDGVVLRASPVQVLRLPVEDVVWHSSFRCPVFDDAGSSDAASAAVGERRWFSWSDVVGRVRVCRLCALPALLSMLWERSRPGVEGVWVSFADVPDDGVLRESSSSSRPRHEWLASRLGLQLLVTGRNVVACGVVPRQVAVLASRFFALEEWPADVGVGAVRLFWDLRAKVGVADARELVGVLA